MSDKNTTPNTAQPTLGKTEKKDNTALIVVIVIAAIIVVPLIFIALMVFAAFGFIGTLTENLDDIDWDLPYSDALDFGDMNEGQLKSATTLWVLSNNNLIKEASIAKKDCQNMAFVAEHNDGEWFANDICNAPAITIGSKEDEGDGSQWLYFTDGQIYAVFNIDIYDNSVMTYRLSSKADDDAIFRTFSLVDTGEEPDPYEEEPYDFGDNEDDDGNDDDNDDDEEIEIHIRPTKNSI